MPGLINKTTKRALPLASSEVTSCVSGYAFGMTASLTYSNSESHPFEGLFIYPLDEYTTVVGFESVISERIMTVQIKDKARMADSYSDCSSLLEGRTSEEGHLVLDEDLERTVFVANLGIIPPQQDISLCISTSSELQTLPSGAVRVLLPPVCVPRVPQNSTEATAILSGHHLRLDRHYCGSTTLDQTGKFCLARLLETETTNPTEYEFTFHLEIRGPCLLAGVESPTHEIRADADPSARSAQSIVITLANRHTFDRPVEILIHPSEPHMPHVLMEKGDMSPAEYERHLQGRSDFIKGMKKDPSAEKKMEIIRKRLHKDIPHHPVVMLNFCPDLRAVEPNLRNTQGEFIILVDRSGSMSGTNIDRVKDALLVILKSLLPTCLFNIIGFGSTFKALFPSSQTYSEDSLAFACESIKKFRADMGGRNILSPLKWIIRQPIHRGHPRLLFLLTDGAVSNTGKVIEMIRNHSFSTRCYTFGIGQNACRRLLKGLAKVSNGSAEFLVERERLQPKIIKSLKKAMAPVISDVSVDWVFPETTEALISPINSSCLFPGDRLVGYSIVCDTSPYLSNPRRDKRRRYSMLHSQESGSSVFFQSQEETGPLDNWGSTKDPESGFPSEKALGLLGISGDLGNESDLDQGVDPTASSRRRAYSANQIADNEPPRRVPTASDPSFVLAKNPLRKAHLQDLTQLSPELQPWPLTFQPPQPVAASPPICAMRIRGVGARRPSLLQQGRLPFPPSLGTPQLHFVPLEGGKTATSTDSLGGSVFSEGRSPSDADPAQHPSFAFETEASFDWGLPDPDGGSSGGGGFQDSPRSLCKAVVKGLQNNKPVQWEVVFDIGPLFRRGRNNTKEEEEEEEEEEDLWNETFHHLAARSVIRDFEQLAERECEIEHGSGRRYHMNAVHTSKACSVISKYTAFLPVDLSNSHYLSTAVEYPALGPPLKLGSQRNSSSESRSHRGLPSALGSSRSPSSQDGVEDASHQPNAEENGLSPCSTPSSSGWDRYTFPDVPLRSPSVSPQKSLENFFAASYLSNIVLSNLVALQLVDPLLERPISQGQVKSSEFLSELERPVIPPINPSPWRATLRLTFNKTRLLTRAARGFMNKPPAKTSEAQLESDSQRADYLPLVSLQLACGAFLLNKAFCKAINVPMEKIKWTSPFASHRRALSPSATSSSSSRDAEGSQSSRAPPPPAGGPAGSLLSQEDQEPGFPGSVAENRLSPPAITIRHSSPPENPPFPPESPADSGRGSESDSADLPAWLFGVGFHQQTAPEGMLWATAVALAWLEHQSAAYFTEWELVAAKASWWLSRQELPEGRSLAAVKGAARQLFVLLRHWDENLEFNLLCYNPSSV